MKVCLVLQDGAMIAFWQVIAKLGGKLKFNVVNLAAIDCCRLPIQPPTPKGEHTMGYRNLGKIARDAPL